MVLDPAISLLGIHPKDYKSFYYRVTCTRMFIVALFAIAKTWNQPKCPSTIDWTRKFIVTSAYILKKRNVSNEQSNVIPQITRKEQLNTKSAEVRK